MLTQSRRTLDKVYRTETETVAYSVGNYLLKKLHRKSDVLLLVIKREVAAFPRYSLNFEATGAREAEENEGEDFGREGGDIRVTRGGGGLGSPYFALMTLPFLGCNNSESDAGEVELRCQASSKSVAG